MLTDFPTDVRVICDDDVSLSREMVGRGRSVLVRALELADRSATQIAKVSMDLPGGGNVTARIFGEQKILKFTAPPPPGKERLEPRAVPREEQPILSGQVGPWSGWIRGPTFTNITVGTPPAARKVLHDWRPIPETAKAYKLLDDFQQAQRLGYSQTKTIRPGMFSGAMKRVVQAIFGIGHVGDPHEMTDISPRYIDASIPIAKRNVDVTYSWVWDKTHGIYKADTKNHWLIEISRANGLLAMPLILIPDTTTPSYYASRVKLGDIGTVRILDEFGGVPTGENFPTDPVVLANAIAAGKIIRLLGASDLDAFYGNHFPYTLGLGWAFSDSGAQAHHTILSERDENFEFSSTIGGNKPYLCTEHWKIAIELTRHDRKKLTLTPPQPVGSGSASIERLHIGRIDYDTTLAQMWCPLFDGTGMLLRRPAVWNTGPSPFQRVPGVTVGGEGPDAFSPNPDLEGWGGIVHVFFDGERLERLKWIPRQIIKAGIRWEGIHGKFPILNYEEDYQTQCNADFIAEAFYAQGPFVLITEFFGYFTSPDGFVGDSVDVRTENSNNFRDPTGDDGGIPTWWVLEDAHVLDPPRCKTVLDPVCTGYWAPPPGWCTASASHYTYVLEPNPYLSIPDPIGDPGAYEDSKNGHFINSIICTILPAFCREGYICFERLADRYILTTWTNPSTEDIMTIDDPAGRLATSEDRCCWPYADIYFPHGEITEEEAIIRSENSRPYSVEESSLDYTNTCVGFFTAAGRVEFDVPETRDVGDDLMCGFSADAGPDEEFVVQNGWQFPTDTEVDYLRVNLPEGLENAVPDKTNWIGTV